MIYSLGLLADVGEAISYAFRVLCGRLATIIYDFIIIVYDLFMYIAKAQILDNDFVSEIYEKVGLILGLFMVFKLIFSLVQSLIDPKKLTDKKNGFTQVIFRMVLAIVMLGIVPTIFREAFKIQDLLVGGSNGNNVIYKLIVGDTISDEDVSFGRTIATELYFSFYSDLETPKLSESVDLDEDGFGPISTNQVEKVRERIELNDESFSIAEEYLGHRINNRYYIEFNEVFILMVGIAVLWILIMYCIQVAVRVFQLAYLQLIAPIPILSYISNPEGSFQKWIKQCTATYLDLFIRLAIIYFVMDLSVYVLEQINDAGSVLASSLGDITEGTKTWVIIFLLVGLLLFAKKVPELIKDLGLFPSGAGKFSFGLNPKKELNNTLAAGLIGGTVGAIGASASNAIHGYMNMKKNFKDNGGIKSGKAWLSAAGAGLKGVASVAGGAVGGAKAGIKTKDITNVGKAVKVANENREKRELKAQAGYHWYRPDKVISDKVLSFAGETTGAEKKIKEAEKQLKSIELARSAVWKRAEDDVKNGLLSGAEYSFIRGLERNTDKQGKVFYSGFDKKGNIINIADEDLEDDARTCQYVREIRANADFDKRTKQQNKIIKGLQTASKDAKK